MSVATAQYVCALSRSDEGYIIVQLLQDIIYASAACSGRMNKHHDMKAYWELR